jgi:hypothetical protein
VSSSYEDLAKRFQPTEVLRRKRRFTFGHVTG